MFQVKSADSSAVALKNCFLQLCFTISTPVGARASPLVSLFRDTTDKKLFRLLKTVAIPSDKDEH